MGESKFQSKLKDNNKIDANGFLVFQNQLKLAKIEFYQTCLKQIEENETDIKPFKVGPV